MSANFSFRSFATFLPHYCPSKLPVGTLQPVCSFGPKSSFNKELPFIIPAKSLHGKCPNFSFRT